MITGIIALAILLPTNAPLDTTPLTCQTTEHEVIVCMPEESPDGGHPTGEWLDNSPTYSDGYTLLVDDSNNTISWRYDGQTDIDIDLGA
jgi:hypothetical protein